jgi:hypothetical protein
VANTAISTLAGINVGHIVIRIRDLGHVINILGLGHIGGQLDQKRGLEESRERDLKYLTLDDDNNIR